MTWDGTHFSLGDILLQTPQSLLGGLENIIVLAHGESEVVFGDVSVGVSVELGWRDSRNSNFLNQEPAELEIARTVGHMRREWVVSRELD